MDNKSSEEKEGNEVKDIIEKFGNENKKKIFL